MPRVTQKPTLNEISKNPNLSAVKIDVFTSIAAQLQDLLQAGAVTNTHLVSPYLQQIEDHNKFGLGLRGIISTAPRDHLLERARKLDMEREHKELGPMHGIPIIVKDKILTPSLGMDTTCGSYALKGVGATRNEMIIERLQVAGMLVIAKANLSE